MTEKLKKIKRVLKINRYISDRFYRLLKIKDLRNNPDPTTVVVQEGGTIEIDFSNYTIASSPYWKSFDTFKQDPMFYAEIPEAAIISKGIVINKSNEVVIENCIFQKEYLNELCSNHFVFFKKLLPTTNYKNILPLLNRLDNNYYHWTMETLSRVLLVYDQPWFKDYKVMIKRDGSKFMKESLQFLFQLPEEQIVTKTIIQKIITVKTLVVSFPHIRNQQSQLTNVYYPHIIQKLNRLAHQRLLERGMDFQNTPKNILISRKNAVERRIVNEDEIINKLKQHHFTTVCLEKLSFEEQVRLFYGAEKIIALHGAGITNIIYGKNPVLIELFPKERNIRDAFYFTQITAALKFKHRVIAYNSCNPQQDVMIDENMFNQMVS